jgi:hypothetical protein
MNKFAHPCYGNDARKSRIKEKLQHTTSPCSAVIGKEKFSR